MASPPLRAARSRSIGEVINLLKPDFPDLTVSKLRFLESQGLVQPSRSSSGYRIFTEEDVRRVEYVLQEQRDHYLPLKVIKSKLAAWEVGDESPVAPETGPPPDTYFATSGVSLTESELMRSSGLSAGQVEELVADGPVTGPAIERTHQFGLVSSVPDSSFRTAIFIIVCPH